jgi:SAM-dependent methyltransferase
MGTRWQDAEAPRGADYDDRWRKLAAKGGDVHGEADFVDSLLQESGGRRVLDGGCGTGRVGIELARRGYAVTGVDADAGMLAAARAKAPDLHWLDADLADLPDTVGGDFDAVVLAGNVMIFLAPGSEAQVLRELARRLVPRGLLVAGFQVRSDRLPLADYDELCSAAGLELVIRYATWDRKPFGGGDYAVSVHRTIQP